MLQKLSQRARLAAQYKQAQARRARIRRLSVAGVLAAAIGTAIGVYLNRLPAPGATPPDLLEAPSTVPEVPSPPPGLLIPSTDPAAGASTTPTGGSTWPDPAAGPDGQQH